MNPTNTPRQFVLITHNIISHLPLLSPSAEKVHYPPRRARTPSTPVIICLSHTLMRTQTLVPPLRFFRFILLPVSIAANHVLLSLRLLTGGVKSFYGFILKHIVPISIITELFSLYRWRRRKCYWTTMQSGRWWQFFIVSRLRGGIAVPWSLPIFLRVESTGAVGRTIRLAPPECHALAGRPPLARLLRLLGKL